MTDQISKGPKDKKSWHSKHHVNISRARIQSIQQSRYNQSGYLEKKVLFNPIHTIYVNRTCSLAESGYGDGRGAGIYLIGRGPAIDRGSANNKHQRYLQYRD